MKQLRIPAVYMRGGTSKGVFFLDHDLPQDKAARDRVLLQGAVIELDDATGKAKAIQRVSEALPAARQEI